MRTPGQVAALNALANQLRIIRTMRGLTQGELARLMHFSDTQISAVETGTRLLTPDFAERADEALETGGLFTELRRLLTENVAPVWLQEWALHEREATALRWYEKSVIPGLLQTADYARMVICGGGLNDEQAEPHVANRLERQAAVLDRTEPAQLVAVLDESVLRRAGDPAVMRDQLTHLLALGQRPNILVHVVPASIGFYSGLAGPFIIATAEGGDVGYLDNQLRGQVVTERRDIDALRCTWEQVRAVALPRRQSAELIEEVMRAWN